MKLGTYYWDGWYDHISHWTDRLMRDFSCRMPVWGWEGSTIQNMEEQIDYAANAGLAFFAFDWYYPEHGHISGMNDAVDRFLKAENHNRMNFCLLVANHGGGFIYRDKWEDACRMFMPYLTDPSALKVDGKPVIIFFRGTELIDKLGDEAECKLCLNYLNEECKKAGLPGVYVMVCQEPVRNELGDLSDDTAAWAELAGRFEAAGVDAITGYNYHREVIYYNGKKSFIFPYTEMADEHAACWDYFANGCNLPYMPCVIGGWDCRPWETLWKGATKPQAPQCYSPDRTPTDVYNHVLTANEWIKAHPGKAVDDLAIIYAWNENGEGGYIEPTIGDQGKILEAVGKAIRKANQ